MKFLMKEVETAVVGLFTKEEVMRDVQREFHDYPEISAFTTGRRMVVRNCNEIMCR